MGSPMLLGRDEERASAEWTHRRGRRTASAVPWSFTAKPAWARPHCSSIPLRPRQTLQVTRITGIEAERDLSFAALHRLLQPSLDRLSSLPQPQRDGLSSALGLASHAAADPFLIGLATLTLLADRATERGLLCVVDDSQWIDTESLQAIAFAARRLQADGIAILIWDANPYRGQSALLLTSPVSK